jgi:Domain of unknown function (DUF4178)
MKAACPQCGADVEFRFDDSFVRVCEHCHAAVVRTDRGLDTLGQFADLAETESPLALFASGRWNDLGFQLVGRAQMQHAAGGVWDEWYARLDDGRWAWLSEAQGRFYLLFEVLDAGERPPLATLEVGTSLFLAGTPAAMTLSELGEATYSAAAGEIPFRLVPGTQYYFADLSGPGGAFATLDYGPGDQRPALYLGEQLALEDLHVTGGATPPPASARTQATRLACPHCDGSIELRAPDQTMRVGCPYCGALIEVADGPLEVLKVQGKKARSARLEIPLGSQGEFEGRTLTVIGWVQRAARIGRAEYPFEEYLLYHPDLGFRWLVESDGHWSYVKPVDTGEVGADDGEATYGGVTFRVFQTAPLIVKHVLGELYWRVEIGERVTGRDYVAPPAMLSCERGDKEINWSLGEWISTERVQRTFPKAERLRAARGVAPNQPAVARGVMTTFGIALSAAIIAGIVVAGRATDTQVATFECDQAAPAPTGGPAEPLAPSGVCFSKPFELAGDQNIAIQLTGSVSNSWISVGGDLVNDATGDVESFERDVEYYYGYTDGESWSEGSTDATVHLTPMPAGRYVMRLELASNQRSYSVRATVVEDVFRVTGWFKLAIVILVPGIGIGLIWFLRERKRWADSDSPPLLLGSS